MILPVTLALALAGSAMADAIPVSVATRGGTPRVLVYTRTLGWRHDSIPTAIEVLKAHAGTYGVSFDFTEDPGMFVDDRLKTYDNIMFVSTSEEVLDKDGQAALGRYFQSGGSFTGVHSASACLFNDTSFLGVIGAFFDYHPTIQQATFLPLNKSHPSTAHLPDRWTFEEEVYYFRSDPRTMGANVIMTVDEKSYTNDAGSAHNYPPMGDPHPIAWYIEGPKSAEPLAEGAVKPGRSFYTSLGHLNETWRDETFIQHVMNGLTWALNGASTRAFNVGIVGNQSVNVENAVDNSTTGSATATNTGTANTGTANTGTANKGTANTGVGAPSATGSKPATTSTTPNAGYRTASGVGIAFVALALAVIL